MRAHRIREPSNKAKEAAEADTLYEDLENPLKTKGERDMSAKGACNPLDAFRYVPSKQSRFKAPPPSTQGENMHVPEQQPGAINRVLGQHLQQPEQACLPPLVPEELALDCEPRVLILGSAPSVDSLAKQQYYANKMNHFWPVVADVFQLSKRIPAGTLFAGMEYKDRVKALLQAGVVVWDVCQLFVRPGSSDSALRCTSVNPVEQMLIKYPAIEVVGLNGQTAHKLFVKNGVKSGKLPRDVRYVCLPSTSPLNAMKNAVAEKARQWREALLIENGPLEPV